MKAARPATGPSRLATPAAWFLRPPSQRHHPARRTERSRTAGPRPETARLGRPSVEPAARHRSWPLADPPRGRPRYKFHRADIVSWTRLPTPDVRQHRPPLCWDGRGSGTGRRPAVASLCESATDRSASSDVCRLVRGIRRRRRGSCPPLAPWRRFPGRPPRR